MRRLLPLSVLVFALGCADGTPPAVAPLPSAVAAGDSRLSADLPLPAPPPPPKRQIDRGDAQKAEPDAHPVDTTLAVAAGAAPSAHLVYTAHLTMAVGRVEASLDAVVGLARSLGGELAARHDDTIRVRVPRAAFDDARRRIAAMGEVLHRDVTALDVTGATVDDGARLANARAERDRLQALLEKATVNETLDVEHDLERVSGEIATLEGKHAELEERLASATIEVSLERRAAPPPALPLSWISDLGLPRLLGVGGAR